MASRHALLLAVATTLASQIAAAQVLFTGNGMVGGNPGAGIAVYGQSCMSCHGAQLQGSPFAPTLIGPAFMNKWRGKPAAELLQKMRDTMPPKGTGTVNAEAFADLLALLVRANLQGPPPIAGLQTAPPTRTAPATLIAKPLPKALAQRLASLSPVTEAMLAAPSDGDWLMWRRTFDVAGFSPLQQIHRGNVQQLRQAWSLALDRSTNEITPLVHDGVLFVCSGSTVLAVDAASGTPLWRYARAAGGLFNNGGQGGRVKSIALQGQSLFVPTPEGHVLALDARSGKLLWDSAIGNARGFAVELSSGPLVARGVVMIGAALGLNSKGGNFIVGLDAATGKERWRFNTVAHPGKPGGDSWNGAPVEERFGGGVWATGSYDTQLNLAYFGIGNTYTTATLLEPRTGAAGVTSNDGLYTDTTVALRPETGELAWHHQHHRRDVWDQDWAFEQTLVTLGKGADAQRVVVTAGKTGIFEALDAATGKFVFAHDTGLTNLFLAVNAKTGEKTPNPALEPVAGKTLLLCPSSFGVRNWPATTLNPGTGTLFVPMLESCADFTYDPPGRKQTANGGTDIRFTPRLRPDSDDKLGRMMALDLTTRQVQWTHRQRAPLAGSLLATAGGLVFMGDLARNFGAFDQASGAQLWSTQLPAAAESTPIAYAIGDRQYIAVVSGEGSRLGLVNRRLDSTLDALRPDITLLVFALPAN